MEMLFSLRSDEGEDKNQDSQTDPVSSGILLQFAAFEREMGAERTRAAKGLPPATVPPLGYNKIEGLFSIDTAEAKLVKTYI